MATVNVRDYGDGAANSAPIGTNTAVLDGVTSEIQIIGITDPDTPDNFAGTELGRLKVSESCVGTPVSTSVTFTAGVTNVLVDCSGTKSKVVFQNYTEGGTNPTFYFGGSTVGYTSGTALLDGDTWTFEKFNGILYGIASAGVTIRVSTLSYA